MAKPDKSLDMSKDYGTISPPVRGAVYYQGGNLFGPDKKFIYSVNPVTGVESEKFLTEESISIDRRVKASKVKK